VHARRAAELEARAAAAPSARAPTSGRIAVPALPSQRIDCCVSGRAPRPVTRIASPSPSMRQPSCFSASSITWVSSECSSPSIVVVPAAKPASRRARFEMLFEPGTRTVPATARAAGCRGSGS
jgi:hypothetical protein